MKTKHIIPTLTALALALTVSCGGGDSDPQPQATAETGPLDGWFTEQAIEVDERPIHELREALEPGAEIAFEGKVMGRLQVFIPGRAAFIVGDPTILTSCDLIPGDECETPWDVCCDDLGNITKGIVTVQLLDDEGRVLTHDVRGVNGLTELSNVRVTGVVAEGSGEGNLIVNASLIQVLPAAAAP